MSTLIIGTLEYKSLNVLTSFEHWGKSWTFKIELLIFPSVAMHNDIFEAVILVKNLNLGGKSVLKY